MQGWGLGDQVEATAGPQLRDDDLSKAGSSGGEQQLDSGYNVEVESTIFSDAMMRERSQG